MAYLDAAATGRLPRLVYGATAVVATYGVAITDPVEGTRYPAPAVAIVLLVNSTGALNSDVHLQVDDAADFATPVYDAVLTNVPDGSRVVTIAGLTNGTTYRARARAAETGTTAWSPWSPIRSWTIDLNTGRAIRYVDLNAGPAPGNLPHSVQYVDLNTGPALGNIPHSVQYIDLNVGFPINLSPHAVQYVDLGDVDTSQPTPHLWFLRPDRGGPGDGIGLYGWGFGDLQATYNGRVEYYDPVGRAWIPVTVTSWVTYPAGPDAYTDARQIGSVDGICTPQHAVIGFTVPAGALPPGYQVRVVTQAP